MPNLNRPSDLLIKCHEARFWVQEEPGADPVLHYDEAAKPDFAREVKLPISASDEYLFAVRSLTLPCIARSKSLLAAPGRSGHRHCPGSH
jgi:hypothetical protein